MKVLIVEDDRDVAESVRLNLASRSHVIDVATDGANGSFLGRCYSYDAIVLDYSLPKKDGLTVCREIRSSGKSTPIIFLSATGDTDTKIAALELGADDYLTKPFSMKELTARLSAVSRRSGELRKKLLQVDDLVIDTEQQTVQRDGISIHLTKKEYCVLEYLMLHTGIIMSRTLIMEHVWSAEVDPFSNTIESHMRNLRKKINVGGRPNLIFNITGRGYILDIPRNMPRS